MLANPFDFGDPPDLEDLPIGAPPRETGFLENFSATADEMQVVGNTDAAWTRQRQGYQSLVDALNEDWRPERGDRLLSNPHGLFTGNSRPSSEAEVFAELRRRRGSQGSYLSEIPATAAEYGALLIARDARQLGDIRRVQEGATGWGTIGGFLGGVAGNLNDPLTVATLPFGGWGRAVLTRIGVEAGLGAGFEALAQPFVAQNYRALGEDYGLGDAAFSILTAGAASGALRGGIEAAGPVGRAIGGAAGRGYDAAAALIYEAAPEVMRRRWAEAGTIDGRTAAEHFRATAPEADWTPDQRAALNVTERSAEIAESSPFEGTAQGQAAHAQRLQEALSAVIEGRPPSARARAMSGAALRGAPAPRAGGGGDTGHRMDQGVVDGLVARGIDPQIARGVAAGIVAETGNNDPNIRGGYQGRALGYGQWLGSRRAEIIRRYGANPSAAQQLDFLVWELRGGDQGGASVLSARNADEALERYIQDFMRPGGPRNDPNHPHTRADLDRGRSALRAAGAGGEAVAAPPGTARGAELAERTPPGRAAAEWADAFETPPLRADLFESAEAQARAQRAVDVEAGLAEPPPPFVPAAFIEPYRAAAAARADARPERIAAALGLTDEQVRRVAALADEAEPAGAAAGSEAEAAMDRGGVDPRGRPFTDWLEEEVGTRRWVVARQLGSRMREDYDLAIPQGRYRALQARWESANGIDANAPAEAWRAMPRPDRSPAGRAAQLDRVVQRAEAGGYGARSGEVAARAREERADLGAILDGDAAPDPALARFDDPDGDGVKAQAESLAHDLRAAIAANPALADKLVLADEGGAPRALGGLLDDLDREVAAVEAMRACL